jgi:predicted dehydrogenase
MKTVIIGCGLIGRKRALALSNEDKLIACCDNNIEVSKKFSDDFHCQGFTDYKKMLSEIDCEVVVVAVVNKFAMEIIIEALKIGRHVIAEKPLGRNAEEARNIVMSDELRVNCDDITHKIILKTGFNHRFHPAVWKAKQMINDGKIGKVFNIRARYGHGGRAGMEKEWRASKELCGGGELLDQGVHVIDLIRWFGGDIKEVYGRVETKFWEMEVEDNAMAILKTDNNITASFHVSWTNWKNIFSFEIYGTEGYLKIEGLGGSYGAETLEFGKRKKEGGRPEIEIFEFDSEDISWKEEWKEFKSAITEKREAIGNGIDGLRANEVIEAIYRSNREKRCIELLTER